MGRRLLWLIIVVMTLVELANVRTILQPCAADRLRRCDLEPPNPVKTNCGLRYDRMC